MRKSGSANCSARPLAGGQDLSLAAESGPGLDQQGPSSREQISDRVCELERLGQIGSWELDLACNTWQCSDETHRIFGWHSREPLTRQHFELGIHPEDREQFRQTLAEAVERLNPFQIEHRIVCPDGGRRWVRTRGEVVIGPGDRPLRLSGTIQDLTESRLLEEELRLARKMEPIWLLTAGVAHDFNNFLTVIRGQAENTLAHETLSAQSIEALTQVVDATVRAAELTRQLLAFSRKQPSQLLVLDLNAVVAGLSKMLRRVLGQDVKLRVSLAPELPRVQADPSAIEQVLMDLAVNARQAMPQGGSLSLTTETVALDEDAVRSGGARPGSFVRLTVQDTGTGIAPEVKPRIFEPFFTTQNDGSNQGLGLPTVANLVQRYHGWIEVETETNGGTAFKIYLPAIRTKTSALPEMPQ